MSKSNFYRPPTKKPGPSAPIWSAEPCVVYDSYCDEIAESITENEYHQLLDIYSNITEGIEEDPDDEVNFMINLPFEMAMVYEGTTIGDGAESL